MNQNNSALLEHNQKNEIAIIFDNETIAQIILEFLGKKETLVYKEESCAFLLRHNDLEQFHYLLQQKMQDQLNVLQLHLTVDFNYSDKTSRSINGFEALKNLNEIRNVSITSTTLTWKIVNKFFNHDHATTQTIELTFDVKNEQIILTITHTNQAWALEIKNLFYNKINEVIVRDSKISGLYKKLSKLSLNQVFPIFVLITALSAPLLQVKESLIKSSLASNILHSFDESSSKNDLMIALSTVNLLKNNEAIIAFKESKLLEDKNIQKNIIKELENSNEKYFNFLIWSISSLLSLIFLFPFIILKYSKYAYLKIKPHTTIITNQYMENEYNKLVDSKKSLPFYSLSFISFTIIIGLIINFISAILL